MPTRQRRLGAAVAYVLVLALVGLIACGNDDSPDEEASAESTETTAEPTTTSTAPTTTVPVVPTEDVTFTTGDGVDLVGSLYGEGTTAIVCSHMNQSSKADFAAAGPLLAVEGFMVLAYDNRGDGESGQGLPADRVLDLLAAIDLVRARGAEQVVLLGASRGGTLSLDAAAQTTVDAIVTLSSPPPVDGPAAVAAVTAPSLYINSENDRFADNTQEMFEAANQPKEIEIYPGGDHGVALFDSEPGLVERIVAFISAQTAA
jgi:pimeloyl-ACP methyl ester carboxylesterase